jgi:hypothetical protein
VSVLPKKEGTMTSGSLWRIVAIALVLSNGPLAAANFWDVKDFSAWSAKEIAKLLSDSPWAHRLDILTPDLSLASRVGGLTGGVVGNGGRGGRAPGGGGVAGDGAGNLGGGSFLASPHRTPIVVRWSSALPVRRALFRQRLANVDTPAPPPPNLDPIDRYYRIAVVGLPFTQSVGSMTELQPVTSLKRKDKSRTPMQPVDVAFEYEGELLTIEFSFSRVEAIGEGDGEIEFVTRLAQTEIKTKFKLKEMMVGGRLEL